GGGDGGRQGQDQGGGRQAGARGVDSGQGVAGVRGLLGGAAGDGRGPAQAGRHHVVMEASGVYTEPVYYALAGQGFEQVAVINPAHARALKGHKTDARNCLRLAEVFEGGLLRGGYIPPPDLKDLADRTRYRAPTVAA